jgi:Peptidase family S41
MFFTLAAAIALGLSSGAAVQARDSTPSCVTLFDGLLRKIEANYAGFKLELGGSARAAFDHRSRELRERAADTAGSECFVVLRGLTDYFGDPHLFVFQRTYLDSLGVARLVASRADSVRRVVITEATVRERLTRPGRLDPLEGIWRDGAMRLAIVPASTPGGHFMAVVLTSDTVTWSPGDVKAEFVRRSDGGYDVVMRERNLSRRFAVGEVHRRGLLRLSPGIWGKEFPLLPLDSGSVDPQDPHRATLTWRGGTPVISIPSHDPGYRGALDSLLQANGDALRQAEYFIVDLRGNEGGSSWVTRGLLAIMGNGPRRAAPYPESDPHILSSEDQIRYVRTRWQNLGLDSAQSVRLIERMTDSMGLLIRVAEEPRPPAVEAIPGAGERRSSDSAPGPRRVGILIDHGTVSAAEAFLLQAMRSARVQTFGAPTAGALDYQSVNIVPIGDTLRRWYLGYPTIAARPDLPRDGMLGKGIAPDVRVDWGLVEDPIGYVDQALRTQ